MVGESEHFKLEFFTCLAIQYDFTLNSKSNHTVYVMLMPWWGVKVEVCTVLMK